MVKYVDLADATSQVQKQIVKWQNAQSDTRLQHLKEHKEYKIEIKPNTKKLWNWYNQWNRQVHNVGQKHSPGNWP